MKILNLSAGSPYYNPHIQRPAAYPPSDGYQPPEDPLVGVARQINVVRQVAEFVKALNRAKVDAGTNPAPHHPSNPATPAPVAQTHAPPGASENPSTLPTSTAPAT